MCKPLSNISCSRYIDILDWKYLLIGTRIVLYRDPPLRYYIFNISFKRSLVSSFMFPANSIIGSSMRVISNIKNTKAK